MASLIAGHGHDARRPAASSAWRRSPGCCRSGSSPTRATPTQRLRATSRPARASGSWPTAITVRGQPPRRGDQHVARLQRAEPAGPRRAAGRLRPQRRGRRVGRQLRRLRPGADGPGSAPYSFPANYPGVLGVAAVTRAASSASFSSDNLSVQVAAPGVDGPGAGPGRAVLVRQRDQPGLRAHRGRGRADQGAYPRPDRRPGHRRDHEQHDAGHRPAGGYDEQVGFGDVNAAAALDRRRQARREPRRRTAWPPTGHFGGGVAAIPARRWRRAAAAALVLYCLLGAACLA